jgi:hypothetical protein
MSSDVPEPDLKELWQNLETERTIVSEEQLQLKAMGFLRKNRRDLIARLAFAILASTFGGFVVVTARLTTVRIAAAVVMTMVLINAIRNLYLSYRGKETWTSCVEFYRSELQKQKAFAALPVWQMIAAFLIIAWLTPGALRRNSADPLGIVLPAVLFAAAGLIVLMAVRKFQARHLQADIEALNSFEAENPPKD